MHSNAYKGGGGGGLKMTKNTHFVRRFVENVTISETFKVWGRSVKTVNISGTCHGIYTYYTSIERYYFLILCLTDKNII